MSELGMDSVSPRYRSRSRLLALLAAPFSPLAAFASRFLSGLHDSRRHQAEQVIERYRHLTEKADRSRSWPT